MRRTDGESGRAVGGWGRPLGLMGDDLRGGRGRRWMEWGGEKRCYWRRMLCGGVLVASRDHVKGIVL